MIKYDMYVEPFLGGGAAYLHVAGRGRPFIRYPGGKRNHVVLRVLEALVGPAPLANDVTRVIGDADAELIGLYEAAVRDASALVKAANEWIESITFQDGERKAKAYFELREIWNSGADRSPGLQLCLRAGAFNGLFRRNRDGEMNVPPRDLERISAVSYDIVAEAAELFAHATLVDWDFRRYESDLFIGPGSLVYLDCPYDEQFDQYIAKRFDQNDQIELIKLAAEWAERGATVVYSNAPTKFILDSLTEFWPTARVVGITASRSVAADPAKREDAREIIALQKGS